MNQTKKKPAVLAAAGPVASPYTDPGNGSGVMNSPEATAIRAVDRKLTDGLNLVHGQLAELREERREDRKELKAEIVKVDERAEKRAEQLDGRFDRLENRITGLNTAIRELTGKVSTALERGLGTRRLVVRVLGAIMLLVTGVIIRPVLERAMSALLGG